MSRQSPSILFKVKDQLSVCYECISGFVLYNLAQNDLRRGTVASPDNSYTYDALYKLIKAEGRELAGNNAAPTYNDGSRSQITPVPISSLDTAAMRTYIQYYEYDEVGNMKKMRHTVTGGTGNWTRDFTIDSASNRTTANSIGSNNPVSESYDFDARGNIIDGFNHLTSLAYNETNMLEVVVDASGDITTYYQYDYQGQRARKVTINTAASLKYERKYFGDWELYQKTDTGTNTLLLERESYSVMDNESRIALIETPIVDVSMTGEVQLLRYQLSNHLSTATLELDDSAAVISYEEYYPYGSTSFQSGRSTAEISLKRYKFTGKEKDDESGFYYHGARYYAPWLARWIAADPLESKFSPESPYNYGHNNPIIWQDSTGMQAEAGGGGGAAPAGGGAAGGATSSGGNPGAAAQAQAAAAGDNTGSGNKNDADAAAAGGGGGGGADGATSSQDKGQNLVTTVNAQGELVDARPRTDADVTAQGTTFKIKQKPTPATPTPTPTSTSTSTSTSTTPPPPNEVKTSIPASDILKEVEEYHNNNLSNLNKTQAERIEHKKLQQHTNELTPDHVFNNGRGATLVKNHLGSKIAKGAGGLLETIDFIQMGKAINKTGGGEMPNFNPLMGLLQMLANEKAADFDMQMLQQDIKKGALTASNSINSTPLGARLNLIAGFTDSTTIQNIVNRGNELDPIAYNLVYFSYLSSLSSLDPNLKFLIIFLKKKKKTKYFFIMPLNR